jgi:hypothetical protein
VLTEAVDRVVGDARCVRTDGVEDGVGDGVEDGVGVAGPVVEAVGWGADFGCGLEPQAATPRNSVATEVTAIVMPLPVVVTPKACQT